MIVIAAVMGECCTTPHLKIVEVPVSDENVAVEAAKRFLEFGTEGWEPGDVIALSEATLDPDYTVPEHELPVWGLHGGDEIHWNDPDEGTCSRVLKVKNVTFMGDRSLSIEEEDGSVVEGFVGEFGPAEVRCQDCGWVGAAAACAPAKHLSERVDPGEPTPVGECPECSALCQPFKE